MKKKSIRITLGVIVLITLIVTIAGGMIYNKLNAQAFNIKETGFIYIDEKKDYNNLLSQLESIGHINDIYFFKQLAERMKYRENIKPGKYKISSDITYLELIRLLRSGQQTPVKLTFNNIRLKKDFAERIGEQLMFSPDDLFQELNNPERCESLGFDTTTIMTLFIPNTYEIYWNTSVDKFLERMKKEHDRFWTEGRLAKAQAISLSPVEVAILASIVEEETAVKEELPIVAGLYINRLKKGMLLQADPTVKFAVGDVTLRRILFRHLEVDSPYNTYRNTGLPPGPIRIPSILGMEGVLNYKSHPYLYMCAKEDFSGTHNFAITLSEHNQNARRYQNALNRNNIK